jgi:hypothetical protein
MHEHVNDHGYGYVDVVDVIVDVDVVVHVDGFSFGGCF